MSETTAIPLRNTQVEHFRKCRRIQPFITAERNATFNSDNFNVEIVGHDPINMSIANCHAI
jgi:hypothetical protein